MANKEHLNILKQGVKVWNQWRADNVKVRPELNGATLSEAYLSEADLIAANLSAANLNGANLSHAHLIAANLSHAHLIAANLIAANLSRANLYGAILSQAKLSRANLSDARLSDARLNEADLIAANLSYITLSRANLSRANLSRANLSHAHLSHAHLIAANLSQANLSHADLSHVDLSHVDLNGADFSNATIGDTTFIGNNLSSTIGLDSVSHVGPSGIGIDTIYRSKGNIPEIFLRRAGVPDNFIAYMRSLAGNAFEFYSCFISYSSKNHDFAERLYADLQNKEVRCWFAPEDMKIGDRIRPRIDETIKLHDKLLLVLSEESIASEWVEAEVEAAIEKEKLGRTVLFPIRLDDAVMNLNSGWPALVKRTRHIGDFTRWKDHDDYQKAFNRLIRDLKADITKAM